MNWREHTWNFQRKLLNIGCLIPPPQMFYVPLLWLLVICLQALRAWFRSKPVSNCVLAISSTLHCLNCFLILVSTSYESLNSVFSSKIIKNHFKTWSEVEKNGHAGWSQRNARVLKLWERRGEWRWGQAKSGNELHAGLSSELGSQKQRLIQSLSALNQVGSVLIQSYEVSKRRFRW